MLDETLLRASGLPKLLFRFPSARRMLERFFTRRLFENSKSDSLTLDLVERITYAYSGDARLSREFAEYVAACRENQLLREELARVKAEQPRKAREHADITR
jgi:hypothetical protein